MARSTFVYVTYIRTTPEKLWSALTDVEVIKQYWFGMHCECQWTAGSSWKLVSGDGQIFDAGEIVEAEPPRRLVIRWQHQNKPELKAEGESCRPVYFARPFLSLMPAATWIGHQARLMMLACHSTPPSVFGNPKSSCSSSGGRFGHLSFHSRSSAMTVGGSGTTRTPVADFGCPIA